MKNVYEVLRQKEMELTRLEKEVEALRLVAPLLSEEKEALSEMGKPALAPAVNGAPPAAAGDSGADVVGDALDSFHACDAATDARGRMGRYRQALAVTSR